MAASGRSWKGVLPRAVAAQYAHGMSTVTVDSVSLRAAIAAHRDALDVILRRYKATNPRLFGSVARGDATPGSDIDLLVDLLPGGGNDLLRVAGVAEELSQLIGTRVDVVATSLLRDEVSTSALADTKELILEVCGAMQAAIDSGVPYRSPLDSDLNQVLA